MTGDRSPTGSRDAVWEVFARQAYEAVSYTHLTLPTTPYV